MSRSSPGPPGYLVGAIHAVERVLFDAHPEAMTAREVAGVLTAAGFRWPLRGTLQDDYQGSLGDVTPERVRRVCEIRAAQTVICASGRKGRARAYSVYEWALGPLAARFG